MNKAVRTRFTLSPSGQISLKNLRTALVNYLFAKKNSGSFVLRIGDVAAQTPAKNSAPYLANRLKAFGVKIDEGILNNGLYAPYYQSLRINFYLDALVQLEKTKRIYKCFCLNKELQAETEIFKEQGLIKKYSRKCFSMPPDKVLRKTKFGLPFVWRFKLNDLQSFIFKDAFKGELNLTLANFSDFAITLPDGSFAQEFADFADDWKMEISHVIWDTEQLTDTVVQLALYDAFMVVPPTFGHLPMLQEAASEKLATENQQHFFAWLAENSLLSQTICDQLAKPGHTQTQIGD
jgi:glutamyl/glutaminyl-tRNA synthetase